MSQDYIHGMHRVGADGLVQLKRFRHAAARQHLMQHVPTDQRHELDGNFKGTVFASLAWKGDIKVHLWDEAKTVKKDQKKVWIFNRLFSFNEHLYDYILAHPRRCHRQWVGCVQALLSIIDRSPISKNCDLEVLHHGVDHLPAWHEKTQGFIAVFSKIGDPQTMNNTNTGCFRCKKHTEKLKRKFFYNLLLYNNLMLDLVYWICLEHNFEKHIRNYSTYFSPVASCIDNLKTTAVG